MRINSNYVSSISKNNKQTFGLRENKFILKGGTDFVETLLSNDFIDEKQALILAKRIGKLSKMLSPKGYDSAFKIGNIEQKIRPIGNLPFGFSKSFFHITFKIRINRSEAEAVGKNAIPLSNRHANKGRKIARDIKKVIKDIFKESRKRYNIGSKLINLGITQ